MAERGATREEVEAAVSAGERFAAKHGRAGFRRNFAFDDLWRGRRYAVKQVEALAEPEADGWLVITVIVRYL
jgi:hypothetical protein